MRTASLQRKNDNEMVKKKQNTVSENPHKTSATKSEKGPGLVFFAMNMRGYISYA